MACGAWSKSASRIEKWRDEEQWCGGRLRGTMAGKAGVHLRSRCDDMRWCRCGLAPGMAKACAPPSRASTMAFRHFVPQLAHSGSPLSQSFASVVRKRTRTGAERQSTSTSKVVVRHTRHREGSGPTSAPDPGVDREPSLLTCLVLLVGWCPEWQHCDWWLGYPRLYHRLYRELRSPYFEIRRSCSCGQGCDWHGRKRGHRHGCRNTIVRMAIVIPFGRKDSIALQLSSSRPEF